MLHRFTCLYLDCVGGRRYRNQRMRGAIKQHVHRAVTAASKHRAKVAIREMLIYFTFLVAFTIW